MNWMKRVESSSEARPVTGVRLQKPLGVEQSLPSGKTRNKDGLIPRLGRHFISITRFASIMAIAFSMAQSPQRALAADTIFDPATGDYCRPNLEDPLDTGGTLIISDFTFTKSLTLCPSNEERLGPTLTTSRFTKVYIWFRFKGDEDFVDELQGRYRAARFTGCVLADYEFVTECKNHRLRFRHDTLEAGIAQEVTADEQVTFDWRFKAALNGRPAGIYRVMLFYHGVDICTFPNQPAPCPIVFEVK